ncbi:hypothetical protein [Nocardioides sp. SYSU D00065]|nr:hypothetical protein [Nocardioides sp. SYSU D00065]
MSLSSPHTVVVPVRYPRTPQQSRRRALLLRQAIRVEVAVRRSVDPQCG